ncbi:MAG: hypothetical protein QM763_15230 [Agriterribacter sp.]
MNPTHFILLNELQQMELIWEKAVYIGEKQSEFFKYILYRLDGMYVEETRYISYNFMHKFRCVEDKESLSTYTQPAAL